MKNVTVIMGENGAGKTALAQSFTWCLYGETYFEDKQMLCKATAREMPTNSDESVRVEIELVHKNIVYTIVREQLYRKDVNGQFKRPNNTKFKISYKNDDGQVEFVKELETEMRMKEILPKELSRYFFFDGERIENMSKEIHRGKSQEFAQAVKSLLGLNALIAALNHLNGKGQKPSVIRSYNESYDTTTNFKIAAFTQQIKDYEAELEKIDIRLKEIEIGKSFAQEKCKDLNAKIKANEESERLAVERDALYENLENVKHIKKKTISSLLKVFNNSSTFYFARKLIKDALQQLSNADKLDKGIPDIHERTIIYLIERGKCLCGSKIEEGNVAYNNLKQVVEYIPPQSVGTLISQFVNECEVRSKSGENFFDDIIEKYKYLKTIEEDSLKFQENIKNINEKLISMLNVGNLQKDLIMYENNLRELEREKEEKNRRKGALESLIERCESDRKKLTLKDENNKRIEIYKAYTLYIYDELVKLYNNKEYQIRTELEKRINHIFKNIYKGGFSLSIDDKYNIQVIVDDYKDFNEDIETSTAQSISIIFAFIAGVIEMARELKSDEDEGLVSEPYPLVMDAPLSAFDKTRIKTICNVLPNIAEQVIIMIKDTDGEIAEKHMSEKIGFYYMLKKENEFLTYMVKK